jgi:hypothetical protein
MKDGAAHSVVGRLEQFEERVEQSRISEQDEPLKQPDLGTFISFARQHLSESRDEVLPRCVA